MAMFNDTGELYDHVKDSVAKEDDTVSIVDGEVLRRENLDDLVWNAVFNESKDVKAESRWLIKAAAQSLGIRSASIQGLYDAMGRGDVKGFVVPAINIRGLTYETARAIFRAAIKNRVGAFIFEIAKSEISYTGQSPSEYASVVLAAAIKEGYGGPVFIQGDHFQVNAKNYRGDKAKEIAGLKALIRSAVAAGFLLSLIHI